MQVKCGCFTWNLRWIWFFRGPVLQPSHWFHHFMIFGFYYFSDDHPWTMIVVKRTNRTKIHLIKMIMTMKIAMKGKEIEHHFKRNQKRNHHTVGERLSLQLMTQPFLGMNSCCLLLKNYPQCSTSKNSGALTSLRTWPPKKTYTQSKSLKSVLIQMHKKLRDLLVFKCWCQ